MKRVALLTGWLWLWVLASLARAAGPEVGPVPADVRQELSLSPFYRQYLPVEGFPIVGSAQVSPAALREAAWIVSRMLAGREDLLRAMRTNRVRLVVMGYQEYTTDVPEHAGLQPKVYWDRRARGLGATPDSPAVSCAEENLLAYPGDPYSTENILIHEFAHAIHETGLVKVDPTFDRRLGEAFHSATNRGLWRGTYAAVNRQEYWAEGTQSWFDNNRENDALHNHVSRRPLLRAYDPALAALCEEVYGDGAWRYRKPADRTAADRAHLADYDPAKAPTFRWRAAAIPDLPRVSFQTALGDIEVELDTKAAPLTVANFLRYVHEGFYSDGRFFRTVRADNQPTNGVKIAVIQAEANPAREKESFAPIPLERTRDTGLRHRDGTLSMAREGPDTATHHVFLCLGDQPELDFGGRRNPDGQGFAAFGRVVKGLEIVRQIHAAPAEGQQLQPPIRIQRAIRLN
jgi:cyclophilin family peptidyl-prolyl cis-trans isomerase